MADSPVEKDVEAQLLNQRKRRRRPGEVPYPLDYTTHILDFDIWDHMFLVSCYRKLTMHHFDMPPSLVLDLGCGGGFWAMEAARQWPHSTIIGYDLKSIQPRLSAVSTQKDLARRVKWVHGNLLDGLPFPPDHFDFVRIAGIGLGVPEDEWQYVLEDVARIMKPGAVLEIIEEDLIFPCGRPPKPRLPPISVDFAGRDPLTPSTYSARSSATLLSDHWPTSPEDQSDGPIKKQNSFTMLHESPKSVSPRSPFSPNSSFTIPFLSPSMLPQDPHPQDHTRLKNAWDAMLARRFLAPQLITVLLFYLSSAFVNIQTHPSLQIPLPPNSQSFKQAVASTTSADYQHRFDPDQTFDLHSPIKRRSGETDSSSGRSVTKSSQRTVPSWAPMHLARTVSMIKGCKEAIWIEYNNLYGNDPSVTKVVKTPRPSPEDIEQAVKPTPRESFEIAWSNWESDMQDRIGMRGRIVSELAWNEPGGERPDWRVWRSKLETKTSSPSLSSIVSDTVELCRSVRGFIARKASIPSP